MRIQMVSRRGAEGAEAAERLCLRRSRLQADHFLNICATILKISLWLDLKSLRPLLPLRLCAKQNIGAAQ
jgi:hypothetical protein